MCSMRPQNVLRLLFIAAVVSDHQLAVEMLTRRRVPSIAYPGLGIRLSEDNKLTGAEVEMAKKKGPNMCVERKLKKRANGRYFCDIVMGRYVCQRPRSLFHTVYYCCPGYKTEPGAKGCPKERYWSSRHALKVLHQHGLTLFLDLSRRAFLHRFIKEQESITLFIPSNDAVKKWQRSKEGRRAMANHYILRLTLLNLMVGGKWPSIFLRDLDRLEMIRPSKNRQLRVKFFRGKQIMMVEGALVVQRDISASNAVIHVIDRFIYPPLGSIRELLTKIPEVSHFNEVFNRFTYTIPDRTTILVPTNRAFKEINQNAKDRMYKRLQCLKQLVFIHVIENVIYFPVLTLMRNPSIVTVAGGRLTFELRGNTLIANDIALETRFVGAKDGAIYIIDKLITPTSALTTMDVLKTIPNTRTMTSLIKQHWLSDRFNSIQSNVTLFVPYDSAFKAVHRSHYKPFRDKSEDLKFLYFHMTPGSLFTSQMYNEQLVPTIASKKMLRINTYSLRRKISVQGSCMDIFRKNIKTCNGVIHLMSSKYLSPSKGTLLDIIITHPQLRVLKSAVQKIGLFPLLSANAPLTVFAPMDQAWRRFRGFKLYELFEDTERLSDTVRYHIIPRSLYSCGLSLQRKYRSLNGRVVRLRRRRNGIGFNYANTIETDISATNGVVHIVDSLVMYLSREVLSGYS